MLNVKNDKDREKYREKMFTEDGEKILENYLVELCKWDLEEDKEFPFKQGIILGVPQLKFAQIIESKEDLKGRIKLLMQLLGLKSVSWKVNDSLFSYAMEVNKE